MASRSAYPPAPFDEDEEIYRARPERFIKDAPPALRGDFSMNSAISTSIGSGDDIIRSLTLSSDGYTVYVAGLSAGGATGNDFFVGRLDAVGLWENEFSSDGWTTTDFGSNADEVGHAVAWQTDGKVVVGGRGYNGSNFDFALARYYTNGALDTGFNTTGTKLHTIGSAGDFLRGLSFHTSGKIIAGGYSDNGSNYDFAAARYLIDGTLDTTFGTGGVVRADVIIGRDDCAVSVAVMSDGRVIAAGGSYNASNNWDISVARFSTVGTLDSTFNSGAVVTTTIKSGDDLLWSVTLDSDEKIVGAGESNSGSNQDFLVVRYMQSGVLDTLFSTDGVVTSTLASGNDIARHVSVDSKKKIVIVGTSTGSTADFGFMKFNTDGSSDTAFGTNGALIRTIGAGTETALGGGIGAYDKVYGAGRTSNGTNYDLALFRFNELGAVPSTWTQQAFIKPHNPGSLDQFGEEIALDKNTLLVGAVLEDGSDTVVTNGATGPTDDGTLTAGAAYVFIRKGTEWSQQAYLKSPSSGSDRFGTALALSGDTALIGVPNEDGNQTSIIAGEGAGDTQDLAANAGAAYVFVRTGSIWRQQAYLKPNNLEAGDSFGSAVALDRDIAIVGAKLEDSITTGIVNGSISGDADNSSTSAGAAYIFERTGSEWAQKAYLKALGSNGSDNFGSAVAIYGDSVAVGAPNDDGADPTILYGAATSADTGGSNSGAAYVIRKVANSWTNEAYIKQTNATNGAQDQFGMDAISLYGDTLAVGGEDDSNINTILNGSGGGTDNGANASGAVYVYRKSGTTWAAEAYLKAPNAGSPDAMAVNALSLYGDTIVAGADSEDSAGTTITAGTAAPTDNDSGNSGAAYVFSRSGSQWYATHYLKAPNSDASDGFGMSVAINGDTLAIGSYKEDSNSAIVNGTSAVTDNSLGTAGAVYIYVR